MNFPVFLRVDDDIYNTSYIKFMKLKSVNFDNFLLIGEVFIHVSIFFEREYDRPTLKFLCDYHCFCQFLHDWGVAKSTFFELFPVSQEDIEKLKEKAAKEYDRLDQLK
jgi:hypothetical protein